MTIDTNHLRLDPQALESVRQAASHFLRKLEAAIPVGFTFDANAPGKMTTARAIELIVYSIEEPIGEVVVPGFVIQSKHDWQDIEHSHEGMVCEASTCANCDAFGCDASAPTWCVKEATR